MKQFLFLILFFFVILNHVSAQFFGPNIHATENNVIMYSSFTSGEIYFNDTTIGMDPWAGVWHHVVMLDTSGNYLWHQMMVDSNLSSGHGEQAGFVVDSKKNIYFASNVGYSDNSITLNNTTLDKGMYILKMDTLGNILNIIEPTQFNDAAFYGLTLTLDNDDNLYIAGTFSQGQYAQNPSSFSFGTLDTIISENGFSGFMAKFDESGNALWLNKIKHGIQVYPFELMKLDFVDNELYLIGAYNRSLDFQFDTLYVPAADSIVSYDYAISPFLAKLDTSGHLIKFVDFRNFGTEENIAIWAFDAASDGYWIGGNFKKKDFGNGITHTRTNRSVYLAKYDFNDSLIYVKLTPSSIQAEPNWIDFEVNTNDEVLVQIGTYDEFGWNWDWDGFDIHENAFITLNPQGTVFCSSYDYFGSLSTNSVNSFLLNTSNNNPPNSRISLKKWRFDCTLEWREIWYTNVLWVSTDEVRFEKNQYFLFPNPVKDRLNIKSDTNSFEEISYQIINVSGQVVKEESINLSSNPMIDVFDLSKGIYFLKIQTEHYFETLKFVKY